MDWKEKYSEKLISAEEAAKKVKSGDRMVISGMPHPATEFRTALGNRAQELENVLVFDGLPMTQWAWHKEENLKAFTAVTPFLLPRADLPVLDKRIMDYAETMSSVVVRQVERQDKVFDVAVFSLTPPDEEGYCNFGQAIWWYKAYSQKTNMIIGEINPKMPRMRGEPGLHISQIAYLVEHQPSLIDADSLASMSLEARAAILPQPSEEEADCIEVIGALCAHEIIEDGDTVQFGVGTVSPAVTLHLYEKHELGLAHEVIPEGSADLVKAGVVTGKYKTLHPGVVTGTAYPLDTAENIAYAEDNPQFELYDWTYISDPRTVAAHDNIVCINTAMGVDLTGQIMSHAIGPRRYSGAGGQLEFAIGALWAKGGRNVTVAISSTVTKGGRISSILPRFPEGSIITVPRGLADYIVTEHGIARLLGKTDRERAGELISIAHPDFRAELRREAQRMLYP